ncbi:hypothetical protein G3T36_02185 [Diaminobutyricibacter tongyongensis]|uniref:HTTM-like domain-containing protein n=1 Tax=Leifsonia tongyongensis TaxID=1268043 RepID=A0A6L9XTF0_9MICO|nr:hypothetical protein [Diaminobutyricibacter tongyongensis]NEN04669.1 hypothetical protein [Diaminobutyricibacter tongyongensis]
MIETVASVPAQLVSIVACLGIALSVSEELVMRRIYADDGLLSWQVLRVARPRSALPLVQGWIDQLFRPRAYVGLLVLKLATALTLLALSLFHPAARLAVGLLAGAMLVHLLLMKRRSVYGLDGADQMFAVVFLGLAVHELMPLGSLGSAAGLAYVGAQSVLSYLISGTAKLKGPSWRDGSAIAGIMSTKIYGNPSVAALLHGRSAFGRLICWSVITFETTFVAVLFVDRPAMWVMLGVGVLFHAGIAVFMGLNSFFIAFVATYPAVAYLNALVHQFLH